MNHLAKHFFDYQSFVNLPHKAVQLHKTPCQQAGVDPTAGWAPKSIHYGGKNLPAPAARANRSYLDSKHSNRHTRPNKFEFRNWGDRHGELNPEKIVPYKDVWMVSLNGEFQNFQENDNEDEYSSKYFPNILEIKSNTDIKILTILTLAPQMEFLTATIKTIRLPKLLNKQSKEIYVKIQLFDGLLLIEEHQSHLMTNNTLTPLKNCRINEQKKSINNDLKMPIRTNSLNSIIKHLSNFTSPKKQRRILSQPLLKHKGESAKTQKRNADKTGDILSNEINSKESQKLPALSKDKKFEKIEQNFNEIEISESFLFRIIPSHIQQCYIFVQIYSKNIIKTENQSNENEKIKENSKESDELLAGCIIGPIEPGSRSHFHWREMRRKKGHPICMWHKCVALPKHLLNKTTETNQTNIDEKKFN